MTDDHIAVVDAALGVFLQYGFKRSTMGDIAQAAGLSRQSLYARFSNKDEVYAAGVELYGLRTIEKLVKKWDDAADLGDVIDTMFEISLFPTFDLLNSTPHASDLVDAAASPEGKVAMARTKSMKCDALARVFEPYSAGLAGHGLTPQQLAEFVETNKVAIIEAATDRTHLTALAATLKASILALTKAP